MKIYKNSISDELMTDIVADINKVLQKDVWQTNVSQWDHSVTRFGSGGVVTFATIEDPIRSRLLEELGDKLPEPKNNLNIRYFVWHRLSNISCHDDGIHNYGATLYLNDYWHIDWGGTFLWEDKNTREWKALNPEMKTLVVNDEKEMHGVSVISAGAPRNRYSIQIFSARETDDGWVNMEDMGDVERRGFEEQFVQQEDITRETMLEIEYQINAEESGELR